MTWSTTPVATFSGIWDFAFSVPGAAIDDKGKILIAWTDSSQQLKLLYSRILPNLEALRPTVVANQAKGSPGVAFSNGQFWVFWRDSTPGDLLGQLKYSAISDPNNLSALTGSFLTGALSSDGPQVTAQVQTTQDGIANLAISVGWRGRDPDTKCWSSFLNTSPPPLWSPSSFEVNNRCNSFFSPAIGYLPSGTAQSPPGGTFLVFRGSANDTSLWSAYVGSGLKGLSGNTLVRTQSGVILRTDNRPSLLVFPNSSGATGSGSVLVVYPWQGALYSTTASYTLPGGSAPVFGNWAHPTMISIGALTTPLAVLVGRPNDTSPKYLLVTDLGATNVFYLFQYRP